MRIITIKNISDFITKHPKSKASLISLVALIKKANWENPNDVVKSLSTAKVISADRVRFKICGNDFSLIMGFKFKSGVAFIKFIGTHKEYDNIDAKTVNKYRK